jgi:hypothetical protein
MIAPAGTGHVRWSGLAESGRALVQTPMMNADTTRAQIVRKNASEADDAAWNVEAA